MGHETTIDAGVVASADEVQSAAARAYLLVRVGDDTRVIDVRADEELLIGRSDEAAVHIEDGKASREHARIISRGSQLVLHDLGSRNGTRVNQDVLKGAVRPLASGDVIWIGDTEILVAGVAGARVESPRADGRAASAVDAPGLVVADDAMVEVFRLVERVAPLSTTVLLLGETGVGKEVVAEQIHRASARAQASFVRINCGALPDNLIESELFGHERGAFTGADRRKQGLFETAHGGTLFLDEIGELKLELQAKLLRALEARKIMRVGGREEIDVDVRIIAASNRDLEAEAKTGQFRGDLFFRLSTFQIRIPTLRERPNEIGLLAELFARQIAHKMGKPVPRLAEPARALLQRHAWPGNVRELRNVIERALVLTEGELILAEHLPAALRAATAAETAAETPSSIRVRVESVEQRAIEDALQAEGGNQTRAARRLGISRRTLIYKLEKYQLRPRDRADK